MSEILRTPDDRFVDLPGFEYTPHYIEIENLRVHYVDEGKNDKQPILLMHGEPSWSYLYRKMIPILLEADFRVLAPDLIGFGRSDKLSEKKDYSYQHQVDIFTEYIRRLNLSNITLFCQDWGGLIGLRVVANEPDRFARIIASNTALPAATNSQAEMLVKGFNDLIEAQVNMPLEEVIDINSTEESQLPFIRWVAYSRTSPEFPVSEIIQRWTRTLLSDEVLAAYEAPFPDDSYKEGARIMPSLVVSQLRENNKAWEEVFIKWEKPFLTAFSDSDPITRGQEKEFQTRIPGAKGQPHVIIKDAGHFLQEDKGEELAEIMVNFIDSTSKFSIVK